MKKNELYTYVTLSLAMLVPSPARFAYGLVMIVMLNILILVGTIFRKLVNNFFYDDLQNVLITVLLISFCILFKQVIVIYSPIIALTLGILFFMPVLTSFVLGNLYNKSEKPLIDDLVANLSKSLAFSLYSLIFFAIRDIFGYGTLSFPIPEGIHAIKIFDNQTSSCVGIFFSSIPGGIILFTLMILLFSYTMKNLEIIATSEDK